MNVLVTGAAGFLGRNLVENLKNIRDGKNRTRPSLSIEKIYEYDRNSTQEELDGFCADCDFVCNLCIDSGIFKSFLDVFHKFFFEIFKIHVFYSFRKIICLASDRHPPPVTWQ